MGTNRMTKPSQEKSDKPACKILSATKKCQELHCQVGYKPSVLFQLIRSMTIKLNFGVVFSMKTHLHLYKNPVLFYQFSRSQHLTLHCKSVQFSSITQSCPTLHNPMNCSMPNLPVHHQLPEFTQSQVRWVGDVIQPSHPLSSPSPPAPNPSRHQGLFQWVSSLPHVAKVLDTAIQRKVHSRQMIFRCACFNSVLRWYWRVQQWTYASFLSFE